MRWMELSLDAMPEAIDWITTLLAIVDSGEEQAISLTYDAIAPAAATNWTFRVRLSFADDAQSRTRVERLMERLAPLQRAGCIAEPQVTLLPEQPTLLDRPLVQPIGQRFVILSPSADLPPEFQARIPLRLEPSHAFGSGWHPATQLSLQLLERQVTSGMKTLDLGCGSGVLSLAMAQLGAQVMAIDTDPCAVQSTQATVRLNHFEDAVTVQLGSLPNGSTLGHWMGGELSEPVPAIAPIAGFDLIVANILARVHLTLAADYVHALRPRSGILVTAGYTVDYAEDINQVFSAVGLECVDRQQSHDWLALTHRFPPH
jgi:ribosomal protein L11 methyltransferase